MKVLEVFGEPISSGGQESFVINVLQHIDRNGLHIDLYTPYYCDNEHYRSIVEHAGGTIFTEELDFLPGQKRWNVIKPLKNFLLQNHYDIVHVHTGSVQFMACAAYAAGKAKVKKIIMHSHSSGDKKTFKHWLTQSLAFPVIHHYTTDYLACSAEAGRWKFSRKICETEMVVIKNGIAVDNYAFRPETRREYRMKFKIPENCLVLGHVGRFSKEKNHPFLLKVFCEVLKEIPDSRLMLVGAGQTREAIEALAEEYAISDKVLFIGSVPDVNHYLQAMDVFLFPSLFEGLGLVAVEAQAAGLPVVASTGVPTEIRFSEQIFYLPLDSPEEWKKAVMRFLPVKRLDTGSKIKTEGYDIQNTAQHIRKIYMKNL